jgi:hypothetical protein
MYGNSLVGREMRLLKSGSAIQTDRHSGQFKHRIRSFCSQSSINIFHRIYCFRISSDRDRLIGFLSWLLKKKKKKKRGGGVGGGRGRTRGE